MAAHQIRIHEARATDFYLRVRSRPIIEDCSGVRFAPHALNYEGIEEDLRDAGLEEETGNWANVDDFKWLRAVQSPNWCLVPEEERLQTIDISDVQEREDVFAFLRLASAIWMCSHDHRGTYGAHVTGLGEGRSPEDWCSMQVIPPHVDAEGVAISALVAALEVAIRLEHPNDGSTKYVYYIAHDTPRVTLVCIDSHYDILYPLPPGATTVGLNLLQPARQRRGGESQQHPDPAAETSSGSK
ncbi:hypothetical protein E2562_008693 [Oryza meyeriana var. granulata]|uniref:C-CAP/cofactor C-like domain-containing protein n=1 Tax=Oryza meyeriana var. granulata TaxID=110450 RepID=A0A6G1F5R9_9ORYZ|nr:hypothetical protein E2562_008693 [Oryza meyeriana var. granulata]